MDVTSWINKIGCTGTKERLIWVGFWVHYCLKESPAASQNNYIIIVSWYSKGHTRTHAHTHPDRTSSKVPCRSIHELVWGKAIRHYTNTWHNLHCTQSLVQRQTSIKGKRLHLKKTRYWCRCFNWSGSSNIYSFQFTSSHKTATNFYAPEEDLSMNYWTCGVFF